MKRSYRFAALLLALCMALGGTSLAENLTVLPQIDNSTARIPITDAIYAYFIERGAQGPSPMCSKTHGAWLNLADGKADIIFLIAPTADEMEYFADAGVDIEMKIYGYDGLVFMGNASNPTQNLSSAEIRSIYRGDITNWYGVRDCPVGGEIVAYIRNPESGSQRMFENLVWTGYEMPDFQSLGFAEGDVVGATPYKMEEIDDMSDITLNVMENRFSIGYNIMSYVSNVFLGDEVEKPRVVTTGSVNLRDYSGLEYDVVASVPAGTELEYAGYTRFDERDVAWYQVCYEDREVWVSSRYSRLEQDNAALKLFDIDGYAPTTENFQSGNYPFVTTSYVAIRADEPADSPARQLFDWIGSDVSRELIAENSTLSVGFSDPVVIHARTGDPDSAEVGAVIDALAARKLTRGELCAFTEDELVRIWQGCYARAGLCFHQAACRSAFEAQTWYVPSADSYGEAYGQMDDVLRANCDLVSQYLSELRRATAATAPRTFSYSWHEESMRGEDVAEMQQALLALGYLSEDACSGKYDQESADAVQAFQSAQGLEATGVFDAVTRMMLL